MQLSKIYANKDFGNVSFKNGLNVIIGKISNREDRELDTHNIGKSLLLEVIDFLLLKGIDDKSKYFLTRHKIFFDYVFFVPLQYLSNLLFYRCLFFSFIMTAFAARFFH